MIAIKVKFFCGGWQVPQGDVEFTAGGRGWGAVSPNIFTIRGTFFSRGFGMVATVSKMTLLSNNLTKNLNRFVLYFLVSKKKNTLSQ